MSTAALIPLAGAAAGVLASGAAKSISSGLSFLSQLTSGEAATSEAPVAEAEATAGEKLSTLDKKLQDFVRRLRERMLLGGVDPNQKLEMQQEPWGSIAANDDHPQKDRVESILAADPLLASEFHQLADEYRQMTEDNGQNLSGADVFQMSMDASGGSAGFMR